MVAYWSFVGRDDRIIIGPFQFSTKFRNRYLKTHRVLGKMFIIAIVVASLCGLYMSINVSPQINISWSVSLFVMALVWLTSVLMAYRMIRLKRVPQHREWMIRTYVITLGFVLFRLIEESSLARSLMPTFEERGPASIWLSWTVTLFFTEVILQWNKKK